jgi:Fe-S-cluster-containing dehydrogenase component
MKACPENAIFKNERGVIAIHINKCTKCGECVAACTYGMIEQYDSGVPYKCDLCGGSPACVAECNFGALVFKETDALTRKQRAEQMKQRSTEGTAWSKRHHLAVKIFEQAVRVPRTSGYLGE